MHEIRSALRLAGRSPGFTALAVLTMALGIGANAAVFSVVYGVLLRPLPLPGAERLAFITREGDVSLLDGVDWRAESRSFESIALFLRAWAFDLSGSGEPERLRGVVAEPQYFEVVGVRPLLGRVFGEEDNRVGGPHVALISERFWQRRFGRARDAVGQTLILSDNPTTVIGVMPAHADFLQDDVDLWTPAAVVTPWAVGERGTNNFDAMGRLRNGATVEEARAEMVAISRKLEAAYPKTNRNKIVEPIALVEFMVGDVRRALWVLCGAVGFVLLIASVNLASLLLARSSARQDEFALRAALGASRWRIVRQLLVEGLCLAVMGGALGIGLAWLGTDALLALAPEGLPRRAEVAVQWPVVAFGAAVTVAAGLAFSAIPAIHVLRGEAASYLKSGRVMGGDGARQRTLGLLVASEVTLACVLLIGSGLLVRTFLRLQGVPLGFDPSRVLSAQIILPESRYGEKAPQTSAFERILQRAQEIPGVETAAYVTTPPLSPRGGIGNRVLVQDREFPPNQEPGARARPVLGDYFRALRIPIVEGRAFTADDREGAPRVAIVNQRFARQLWPGESALGKRIAWRDWMPEGTWMEVVGVAADVKATTLTGGDVQAVYMPYVQRDQPWQRFGTLVVRARGDAGLLRRGLREAVWTVDPTVPLEDEQTLDERVAEAIAPQQASAFALAVFAGAALLLAVQGLYALLAYAVERRRREIAVRMALGARSQELLRLVIGRGMALTVLGLAVGVPAAILMSSGIQSLLYEVEPTDPFTYALVAVALAAAAFLACAVPAHRAARLDPMAALRSE
ncbi:MAG TPA: ABC transporter permease [Vicinamibacteria bacterium]|jgi:putative ABC transport system permease protein